MGPGLDILGLAVAGAGDTVTVRTRAAPGVVILDPGHPALPSDAARHTAGIAATETLRLARVADKVGLELSVEKGLPLAAGQGGSAASAVAAAVATNALLPEPLAVPDLITACLAAERHVAGRHADNIAPSLLGGLVLVRSLDPIDCIPLPLPAGLNIVLAHPDYTLPTAAGRAALPSSVSLTVALAQAAAVGAVVAAGARQDLELLRRAVVDLIAEPAREPLLPGFRAGKAAGLAAGALCCSISGSGPTMFAFTRSTSSAHHVAAAIQRAYRTEGIPCETRLTTVDPEGAQVR